MVVFPRPTRPAILTSQSKTRPLAIIRTKFFPCVRARQPLEGFQIHAEEGGREDIESWFLTNEKRILLETVVKADDFTRSDFDFRFFHFYREINPKISASVALHGDGFDFAFKIARLVIFVFLFVDGDGFFFLIHKPTTLFECE